MRAASTGSLCLAYSVRAVRALGETPQISIDAMGNGWKSAASQSIGGRCDGCYAVIVGTVALVVNDGARLPQRVPGIARCAAGGRS
jgi:hypothetical protein